MGIRCLYWLCSRELDRDVRRSDIVNQFRIGTAVLCVAALNPIWPGDNGPQRVVDQQHVNELADRFATGISRSAPGQRFDVTMSRDLAKRAVDSP
jgi:hypothetical protein